MAVQAYLPAPIVNPGFVCAHNWAGPICGSLKMCNRLFSVLAVVCMCALLNAETVNVFDLCGTGLIPKYVDRSEDLILEMNDNWLIGDLSCTVRLKGADSDDILYYQFSRFTLADSSVSVRVTMTTQYGQAREQKTFTNWKYPSFSKQKGNSGIIIRLSRGSSTNSETGLSASMTISNGGNTRFFKLSSGTIVGIVCGVGACILGVIILIYHLKRKRQRRRGAVVQSVPPAYPGVGYNNTTAAPPGLYPVAQYDHKSYQPQVVTGFLPPPAYPSLQPQGVPPGNPHPYMGQPPPYQAPGN